MIRDQAGDQLAGGG